MSVDKIVFYDKMDNDGRGARAVFELAHEDEKVLYVGLDRDLKDNDKVHYLDFIATKEEFEEIYFLDLAPRTIDECNRLVNYIYTEYVTVTIVDHHPLQYSPLDFDFKYIFDKSKSACLLTWEHFNKGVSAPYVVMLINDRDMWLNKMQPTTNYFHNVSDMMNERELLNVIDESNDPIFNRLKGSLLEKWLTIGKIREQSNKNEIKDELENMRFGELLGVNIAYTEQKINYDILSQLGNEACELFKDKVDVYCHVYQKTDGRWSYSMRSLNGQAKKIILDNGLNGGGHDNACGFKDDRYLIEETRLRVGILKCLSH